MLEIRKLQVQKRKNKRLLECFRMPYRRDVLCVLERPFNFAILYIYKSKIVTTLTHCFSNFLIPWHVSFLNWVTTPLTWITTHNITLHTTCHSIHQMCATWSPSLHVSSWDPLVLIHHILILEHQSHKISTYKVGPLRSSITCVLGPL